jgi:hypothetical protein
MKNPSPAPFVLIFALVCGAQGCLPPSAPEGSAAPTGKEQPGAGARADEPTRGASESPNNVTVRYWLAGCSVSDDLWRFRKSSTVTCDARGRSLEGEEGVLVWTDYLGTEEMDTLVVEGEGLDTLQLELSWWADHHDADEPIVGMVPGSVRTGSVGSGSVGSGSGASDSSAGGASSEVRFELAGVPEWDGLVRRFQLTWSGTPSPSSRILAAWGTGPG